MSRALTQTWALLIDAYRELSARKLFWITLALSVLVVSAFAMIGVNERGFSLLWYQFDNAFFNTSRFSAAAFYKFVFATMAIPIWLTWAATILALVSTSSIIPDFIANGSIEMSLSRPIGRTRLLITKFAGGLLFAALQVFVFSAASFVVIGVRGGEWLPELFMAVPIVTIFFSYLFAFCVLFGLLTGSAVSSLLLTLVVWFALFMLNIADGVMLQQRAGAEVEAERAAETVEARRTVAERMLTEARERGEEPQGEGDPLDLINPFLPQARTKLTEAEQSADTWITWHKRVLLIKTVLPKTRDTIELLPRWIISQEEANAIILGMQGAGEDDEARRPNGIDPEVFDRMQELQDERGVWWVLGSSLAFEFVLLGVCAVMFRRRDF